MGDIKFEGNEVIVEGSALKVTARDVEVDNEGRRIDQNTPHRRALVHDFQDGLTINWAKDYPGGVTIRGDIAVDNKIKANRQLIIDAWDLCLDSPGRRIDDTQHRRALVHDFQDGLTINWAKDYPGGVTIRGDIVVDNKIKANRQLIIDAWDLCLDSPGRRVDDNTPHRRALVHDHQDGLTINWAKDYPAGVTVNGEVRCPDKLFVGSTDVQQVISSMQAQIDELRARIAALET